MTNSSLHQAVDRLLEDGIEVFVTSRRSTGRSWRRIGNDLRDATGIDVSYETLRAWFPDEPSEKAS